MPGAVEEAVDEAEVTQVQRTRWTFHPVRFTGVFGFAYAAGCVTGTHNVLAAVFALASALSFTL